MKFPFYYGQTRRTVRDRSPKRTCSRALSSDLFWTSTPLITRQAGCRFLKKAWNLLSDNVKASLQSAESNLNALSTVDLGPKRPFSVGECALWARLTGPQFSTQVAAVVSLVEAPANHCEATTAEAAVAAAEAIAVADLEEAKRLAAQFEALGGVALIMALAQEAEPGDPCASAGSYTSGSACRRPARSAARKY